MPQTARWMFPSPRTNGPLSHNGLDETWRRIREEADLRDVRLHDLRHSYASTALQHGETVLTIGRLLGHGHPTTTLKYTHWAGRNGARGGRSRRHGSGGLSHDQGEKDASDRCRHCQAQARRERIHDLTHLRC